MFKPKNQRFGFFIGYMMYHFLCLTVLKCWRKMAGTKKLKISIERERRAKIQITHAKLWHFFKLSSLEDI